MLRRIYIDNFRCLVNFSLSLENITVLMGENGSGKSCVFEVLKSLQRLVCGEVRVEEAFSPRTLTRWVTRYVQTFELQVDSPQGNFLYRLLIEHEKSLRKLRIAGEYLLLNDKPLFRFADGEVQLFRDDHSEGPTYPFDWAKSGLSTLQPRHDNTHLSWFKEHLEKYLLVSFHPDRMISETRGESSKLLPGAENFSSWYRYLIQEHQKSMFDLNHKMREIFDNFHDFKLRQMGEQLRTLEVGFGAGQNEKPDYYGFDELSDGQRVIIVLYALMFAARDAKYTLFLDEPDNFMALAELQPWIMDLIDLRDEAGIQAIMISHHPELIDFLGSEGGIWLEREAGGPTRIGEIAFPPESTLKLSELIERGWISDGQK